MEFFEFVLLFSIVFILPLTILKTVLDYKKSKIEAEHPVGEGAGLTVGELKKVLADVVREANAPLLERVERLEREREGLPPSARRDLLVGVDEQDEPGDAFADEDAEAGKTVGRRVHG